MLNIKKKEAKFLKPMPDVKRMVNQVITYVEYLIQNKTYCLSYSI